MQVFKSANHRLPSEQLILLFVTFFLFFIIIIFFFFFFLFFWFASSCFGPGRGLFIGSYKCDGDKTNNNGCSVRLFLSQQPLRPTSKIKFKTHLHIGSISPFIICIHLQSKPKKSIANIKSNQFKANILKKAHSKKTNPIQFNSIQWNPMNTNENPESRDGWKSVTVSSDGNRGASSLVKKLSLLN